MSITQVKTGLGRRLGDYIGVKETDVPSVRIIHPVSGEIKKFIMTDDITEENILNLYQNWVDGKLKPTLKTAEIPAESHEEGVRVLVGKNFQEVV